MKLIAIRNAAELATPETIKAQMRYKQPNSKTVVIGLLVAAKTNPALDVRFEVRPDGCIMRVFVGIYGLGIVAQYDTDGDKWFACVSNGNCGHNYACGGTWQPSSGGFRPVKPDQTTDLDMSFHKTATPRDVAQLAGVRSKCRYHRVTVTSKTVTIQSRICRVP